MLVLLLRRLLSLLIVTAYLGATMAQPAPDTAAMPAPMQSHMAMSPDGSGDPMPCHQGTGMVPGCMTDLGCVFLVSLPAMPALFLVSRFNWSVMNYSGTAQALYGRSVKPALGPPITLA